MGLTLRHLRLQAPVWPGQLATGFPFATGGAAPERGEGVRSHVKN